MSVALAKLKLLYKSVKPLYQLGNNCYVVENFGSISNRNKNLVLVNDEDVALSMNFERLVVKDSSTHLRYAMIFGAEDEDVIRNMIVFVKQYTFEYICKDGIEILNSDIISANCGVITFHPLFDKSSLYTCPMFLYGECEEDIVIYYDENRLSKATMERYGKWGIRVRNASEMWEYIINFKDMDNIIQTDKYFSFGRFYLNNRKLSYMLDIEPFYAVKIGIGYDYAILIDYLGLGHKELKCWKFCSLQQNYEGTGTIRCYLLNESDKSIRDRDNFVDVTLVKSFVSNPTNVFEVTDKYRNVDVEEKVIYTGSVVWNS